MSKPAPLPAVTVTPDSSPLGQVEERLEAASKAKSGGIGGVRADLVRQLRALASNHPGKFVRGLRGLIGAPGRDG